MNSLTPSARVWQWCGRGSLLAVILLAQIAAGTAAWGQATTSVRGTITDSSGGAVGSAAITITSAESRIERTATSGSDGSYQFLLLPPGTYKLAVSAQGFQRYEETGLQAPRTSRG